MGSPRKTQSKSKRLKKLSRRIWRILFSWERLTCIFYSAGKWLTKRITDASNGMVVKNTRESSVRPGLWCTRSSKFDLQASCVRQWGSEFGHVWPSLMVFTGNVLLKMWERLSDLPRNREETVSENPLMMMRSNLLVSSFWMRGYAARVSAVPAPTTTICYCILCVEY